MDEEEFGPSGIEGAEGRRLLHVVIIGSTSLNSGYKLVGTGLSAELRPTTSIHSMC